MHKDTLQPSHIIKRYWPLFLILIVCSFLFLINLNRDTLGDWDECLYSQHSKEMKISGNFLTPTWNGHLILEKPPLTQWIMQIPYAFGINEFTSRIHSVIFTLLLITAMYIFCKKYLSVSIGIISILLFLSCQLIIPKIGNANTDIIFLFFIFSGFYAWIASKKDGRFSYIAGLLFGLAGMTKGVSVAPYLAAAFLSIFLDFKKQTALNFVKMIAVFTVVFIPWHIVEYMQFGNTFIHIYILDNVLKRANNPIEFHMEGRLFYAKLIFKTLFPWIFMIIPGVIIGIMNYKKYSNLKKIKALFKNQYVLFTLLLFIAVPLISLTKAATRLSWYAMPLYPFIVIVLGYSWYIFIKKLPSFINYVFIVILAVFTLYTINIQIHPFDFKHTISRQQEVLLSAKQLPDKELNYLVWHGERKAEAILPANMRLTTTFLYGGNPCALFYSDKKVNYFYSIDKFNERLQKGNGIFLIEGSDKNLLKPYSVTVIKDSTDYVLFRLN